jgi:gas vesicle protein
MVMKVETTNRKHSILKPVLIGSAVGAGIALTLAPKSGKGIRKDLKRFAATTRDRVADVIDEGMDMYEEVGDVLVGAVKTGKKTFDEGTKGLQKLIYKKERSLMAPILVSGVIGAGIALLLAPKSGREVRGDLKRIAAKTQDNIVSAIDKGKALYREGRKGVFEAVEAGKKAFVHEKEKFLHAA